MKDHFNNRPYLVKGAIVAFDTDTTPIKNSKALSLLLGNPLASIVIFQYNPMSIERKFTSRVEERDDEVIVNQAPGEEISLEIQLSAQDQITAPYLGITPQLATLEMLLYPRTKDLVKRALQIKAGLDEVSPQKELLTLFVWGYNRIIPIRITSFSITEEAHNHLLNPIRAKVAIDFNYLSYADFETNSKPYIMSLVAHGLKEAMATMGSGLNVANAAREMIS